MCWAHVCLWYACGCAPSMVPLLVVVWRGE
nr:MAG TPA: hypothetical protein [Caudoviricetes sp.]